MQGTGGNLTFVMRRIDAGGYDAEIMSGLIKLKDYIKGIKTTIKSIEKCEKK